MMFIPVRGLFSLVRAAQVIAVTAAVPFVIKKSKPLAEKVGKELVKLGEWLQDEPEAGPATEKSAPKTATEAPKADAPKAAAKPAAKKPAAKKPTPKTTSKPTPPKQSTVKARTRKKEKPAE